MVTRQTGGHFQLRVGWLGMANDRRRPALWKAEAPMTRGETGEIGEEESTDIGPDARIIDQEIPGDC